MSGPSLIHIRYDMLYGRPLYNGPSPILNRNVAYTGNPSAVTVYTIWQANSGRTGATIRART